MYFQSGFCCLLLVSATHCYNFGVQATIAVVVFLSDEPDDGSIAWGILEIKIQ